ncbi:protein MANNAN SYNTHESIS-RELATED 1 [Citrus sinensis]|uniref:Protein MANNAN SYNTHESIS-RELATED 1 n=1 Tax=Citrus sinensis TaxID=2711 RepID=A0ACB8JFN6_CITSI|nr:protein MANNAN SYNTHESIS-RELATED 1 [Citrus sinensis]
MGVDLRQVVAGILTLTMFVMLGNMIKRDHFDSITEKLPGDVQDVAKVAEEGLRTIAKLSKGPWLEDGEQLKPCWSKTNFDEIEESRGYVTFSLTNGPEYHVSQIADAVVVARVLRATLVVPDIRGSKPGDERLVFMMAPLLSITNTYSAASVSLEFIIVKPKTLGWVSKKFEDVYDVNKFIRSLDGVVKVVKELPEEISFRNLAVVKVPNRVTEDHIIENIQPIFKAKGNIRLATYFPSVNMRKSTEKSNADLVACLAMFGTLELQPDVNEVVDSMVERLRTLSRKSDGRFIAVDLRVDLLDNKGCHEGNGRKSCYGAHEIAVFLRKIGYDKDTTIYLTQSRWDSSLSVLKDIFPKTYTKENITPADKKEKFLDSEDSEFEKVIDFYLCSQSDAFVPAISGLFYANVAGKRIASGKNQILVPADISGSSASATDFISPYVLKKNHMAHSCFC